MCGVPDFLPPIGPHRSRGVPFAALLAIAMPVLLAAVVAGSGAPTATDETNTAAEGATITGTLDFVPGADGATVTAINGTTLAFNPADSNYSQPIDIGTAQVSLGAQGHFL